MMKLHGRKILLIISGGIAAYKSLDLIRKLRDDGAEVRCILTDGGAQFITPLSVSALSGHPVATNMFSTEEESRFGHIRLARESDLIVVAPASADMMAKMAHGLADNLAAAVLLASDKPVMIAPAMNCQMWQHPATQANIATLQSRGVIQVGPNSGSLACGEEGAGRMSEPTEILEAVCAHFAVPGALAGKRVLVTSGPTFEPIDPVRFIGNRSSGKQGHAIAAELALRGAEVILVSGPTALPDPIHVRTLRVETARQMAEVCLANGPYDIAICAAAVADWRPTEASDQKIKKGDAAPQINLCENPDILASLSKPNPARPKLVIGFAAETDKLLENAAAKFARKGCDWLLANEVGEGKTFGQDENCVTLIRKDSAGAMTNETWPETTKSGIAHALADAIQNHFSN